MQEVPQKLIDTVVGMVEKMPQLAPTEDTPIRFASDDITFSLRELGYTLENGRPIPVKREGLSKPIMASWFINHKKLKTDLGNHAFSAPFVYADDVRIDTYQQPEVKATRTAVTSTGQEISQQKPAEIKTPEDNKVTTGKRQPVIAEPATPENLEKYGLAIPTN